jgi:hypothetical protein
MPKSKSIHLYATRADLGSVIAAVESQRRLQYVQAGMFDSPEITLFASGLQIPNLGLAPSGDSNHEPFWLITDSGSRIEVKSVPQRRGGIRYGIDPELNPESVVLWPGGVFEGHVKWRGGEFNGGAVIAGQVGTAMFNPTSIELVNLFASAIRRQLKRIKSYFVGPEAERLLDAGYRLTSGITSSREIDLAKD